MTYVVRSIPQGKNGDASSLPDMRGAWIILPPINARSATGAVGPILVRPGKPKRRRLFVWRKPFCSL